jgi:galactokinase
MDIERLRSSFQHQFGHPPTVIVRSPGRINLIGEHTDYNDGFVLPAAITQSAYLAISLRTDNQMLLHALDLSASYTSSIDTLRPITAPNWPNYLLGSAAQFLQRGIPLSGFNVVLSSDVPMGAGLSSSAAVECAMVYGLNALLDARLSRLDLMQMAQMAEHHFAGVQCGIMDQFASMMGQVSKLIQLDCRSLDYQYLPFDFQDYHLVLLNTHVKHSLASSAYNQRRAACQQAVEWIQSGYPEVRSLRDANPRMLEEKVLAQDPVVYRQAHYVVKEISRLQAASEALRQGNLNRLGQLMFETHDGLQQEYEVSCRELDFLVDFARRNPAVVGARMMGGGFGGCTLNIVASSGLDTFLQEVRPAYEKHMQLPLSDYRVQIGGGTEIIAFM